MGSKMVGVVVLAILWLAAGTVTAEKYCNGQVTKVKRVPVYPNGKPMLDGDQQLYPDGKPTIKDGKLVYPNGQRIVISGASFYPNGHPLRRGNVYYLPNQAIFSSGGVVYRAPGNPHPNPPKFVLYLDGKLRYEFPVTDSVPTLTTFDLTAAGPDYMLKFRVSDGVISDFKVDCSPQVPFR
jgi:hypothetical protein